MLTRREDVWPWGWKPVLLCKCCGQPGANSFIDISCLSARISSRKSRGRRPLDQPKLPDHELRLLGACGKERTGFPQADAAQPVEIPHPVDPETWKRYYTVAWSWSVRLFEFVRRNLYWLGACTLTPSASGRGV